MLKKKRYAAVIGLFVSICLLSDLSSCLPRHLVVEEFTDIVETGIHAFEQDDDLGMLERALPAHIQLLVTLLANDPDNAQIQVLLAKLYGFYGFAFIELELEKELMSAGRSGGEEPNGSPLIVAKIKRELSNHYARGAEYALSALEQGHPGCRQALGNVGKRDAFIAALNKKDVPALFWYGFNMGAYINQNRDSVRAIAKAGVVEKVMQRVIALDESYFYHTAHLVLLAYYHNFPPLAGGNPKLARYHYGELKNRAGEKYLLAELYYARYILFKKQDRQGFIRILKGINGFSMEKNPYPLLNAIAQARAKVYLNSVDYFFD